jgi:hypothetical protein
MKTSVELDEKKVKLARKLSDTTTLRDLLDQALDAYIARERRNSMSELLGTRFFDGNLKKMRAGRGSPHR